MRQMSFQLIEHKTNNQIIHQRPSDGYINATALCQAAGKRVGDYIRLDTTTAFNNELSADMGIPISGLIQIVRGGGNTRIAGCLGSSRSGYQSRSVGIPNG